MGTATWKGPGLDVRLGCAELSEVSVGFRPGPRSSEAAPVARKVDTPRGKPASRTCCWGPSWPLRTVSLGIASCRESRVLCAHTLGMRWDG